MSKPLVIDLCCGLGGWTRGFLAEGYDAIGFDIERHVYGPKAYPAQLVLQDIRTLHGSQFRDAAVIVASPPCQAYSYMAMPWRRAKMEACWQRWSRDSGSPFADPFTLNVLFDTCFRIACEAGVPLVVENVKGAQPWVGWAAWHHGSYDLWGDVPALMPFTRGAVKVPGVDWHNYGKPGYTHPSFRDGVKGAAPVGTDAPKDTGKSLWFFGTRADPRDMWRNEDGEFTLMGIKQGGNWWHDPESMTRRFSSRSDSRKAASAMIAEIPFDLANWIARCFKPDACRLPMGIESVQPLEVRNVS